MKSSFAKRVRAERKRAGLSQNELADICGLTPVTISSIECGKSVGSEATVASVARALKVRTEWLKGGSGRKEAATTPTMLPDAPGPQIGPESFAEGIQRLRKENGLTQRELAALVGVSTSTVGLWESGDVPPV